MVDVNVLVCAVNADDARHGSARRWIDDALSGRDAVGLPWMCLLGFVRVVTNSQAVRDPLSTSAAMEFVADWLGAAASTVVNPGPRHVEIVRGLLEDAGGGQRLVNDAHIAALAVEASAVVVSYDRDFRLFRGVRLEEPA